MDKLQIHTSINITKTITIDVTTDYIERILTKELNLSDNVEFDWHTGQWPSLTIIDKIITKE